MIGVFGEINSGLSSIIGTINDIVIIVVMEKINLEIA